jgi:hypothetical protein
MWAERAPATSMNLLNVIRRLCASKINNGMRSLRDGGLKVWLENERKEIKAEREFPYAAMESEVAAWLDEAARKHFPESEYGRD